MRKLLAFLVLLLLGVSFLAVSVRAQDDDEGDAAPETGGHAPPQGGAAGAGGGAAADADDDDDEKADIQEEAAVELKPSPDVTTAIIFPDFKDKHFHIGEKVTLLIGVHNTGAGEFNITGVQARLHSPYDYNYYIQNFTYREVGVSVGGKQQAGVEYVFQPDKSLEPIEYHLSAYIDYNDTANNQFRTFVTNGTVELIEKPSSFDTVQFFRYFLLAAGAALAGYVLVNVCKPAGKPSSSVERGTRTASAASEAEWAGEIYTPSATPKKAGTRKRKA